MFPFLKRKAAHNRDDVYTQYTEIIDLARNERLYTEYGVPDTPAGRFQMITLHAAPVLRNYAKDQRNKDSQLLFDMIFKDIELSFREIGVGDLSVPKKMRAYMKDFNGAVQAYNERGNDVVAVVERNVFNNEKKAGKAFRSYIEALFGK